MSLTNDLLKKTSRARLEPDHGLGPCELSDKEKGLTAYVTRAGHVTYYARYRRDGRQIRFKIGDWPGMTISEARDECRKAIVRVAKGEDPHEERRTGRNAPTVADAAKRFLEQHGPKLKTRTLEGYEAQLERHILPAIGNIKIGALTGNDVASLHSKIGRKAKGAANRCLALVSSICAKAERWKMRPQNSNPCRGIERFPEEGAGGAKGHYLDAAEVAALVRALDEAESAPRGRNDVYVSPGAISAIRLLLHTGMRVGEVIGLEWRMVDLTTPCLRLPTSKTGAKVVPLGASAVRILEQLKERRTSAPWVVTSETDGPVHNIQRAWRSIRKRAQLEHVRLHDLRHSYASTAIEAGAPLELVGRVLGHRSPATTQRYKHIADAAMQATVATFSAAMEAKIAAGSKVARLPVPEAKPKRRKGGAK